MAATTAENQIKAGKADAIEIVLKAISVHKGIPDVCEWGFVALGNITLESSLKKH